MIKIKDPNGRERECISAQPDKNYPGFVKVDFESKIRKGYKHCEWYPLEEFYQDNPDLKKNTDIESQKIQEDTGSVTVSGENYLQDVTKDWKKNAYKGVPLWISRGKGESQQRIVVKNDKNKLYINKNWEIKPDSTSQYVLSYHVQENIEALGNTLPGVETKDLVSQMIKKAKKSV